MNRTKRTLSVVVLAVIVVVAVVFWRRAPDSEHQQLPVVSSPSASASGSAPPTLTPNRHDDNGIARLEFGADAFERVRRFTLDTAPIATMGGATVDPAFDLSDASKFALLSDGSLAALSPFGSRLLLFGPDGVPQQRVGSEGEGPAEFRSITDMVRIDGDTLLVPDYGNVRMNWVIETGEVVRAASLKDRVGFRFNHIAGILGDGAIVLYSSGRLTDGKLNQVERQLADVVLLPSGDKARVVATVPDVETERVATHYEGMAGSEVIGIGFSRLARVAVWGQEIVTASGDGYRLEIRDATGTIRSTIDVAVPRTPVTPAMHNADVARRLEQLHGYTEKPWDLAESERLIREAPYADSLPPYSALHVTPDHTLWVVDPIVPGDTVWAATAFHRDGTMVGRLVAHSAATPVAFGDSVVAVRSMDQDGVVTIEVWGMRVGGVSPES